MPVKIRLWTLDISTCATIFPPMCLTKNVVPVNFHHRVRHFYNCLQMFFIVKEQAVILPAFCLRKEADAVKFPPWNFGYCTTIRPVPGLIHEIPIMTAQIPPFFAHRCHMATIFPPWCKKRPSILRHCPPNFRPKYAIFPDCPPRIRHSIIFPPYSR